jgi:MinD superfamily P-loop ATPase
MAYEIAVISGKGGTGKTTLSLSILPFLEKVLVADCDVDAPDMNILLQQKTIEEKPFIGFQRPTIDYQKCIHCGKCYQYCKFHAITSDIQIKNGSCEGCNVCAYVCPTDAITMEDHIIGQTFVRETPYGIMVDARLHPGEESSGKLVSEVREQASKIAQDQDYHTILIDGSPGIACNVISTITGVDLALIVTEPTQSGLHDLKRVLQLTEMFSVKRKVIINKFDLNHDMTNMIQDYCDQLNTEIILKIPFDKAVVCAISNKIIPSKASIPFFKSDHWFQFINTIKK